MVILCIIIADKYQFIGDYLIPVDPWKKSYLCCVGSMINDDIVVCTNIQMKLAVAHFAAINFITLKIRGFIHNTVELIDCTQGITGE